MKVSLATTVMAFAAVTIQIHAAVSLPSVFSSNMVLQRNQTNIVWGTGTVGDTVSVSLSSGQADATVVDAEGKWAVSLPITGATNGPLTLIASAPGSSVTLTNLAVGEVWLCGGQSNMDVKFSSVGGVEPRIDPSVFGQDLSRFRFCAWGQEWQPLTADVQHHLSVVSFYFGIDLYEELDVPIGLVVRAIAGSPIQSWMPAQAAEEIQEELNIPEDWRDWHELGARKALWYNDVLDEIIPIAIRGVIWYQGERNAKASTGWEYRHLLPKLIESWREVWADRAGTTVHNFPFYYVQVPTQGDAPEEWPWLRDGMRRALDLTENTGMAIFYDYGPSLHPDNTEPAGHRLALWALAKDYGHTNLVHCGPLLDQVNITGSQAVLTFDHIGGGLANKSGGTSLDFFEIAGSDGEYVPADAWIDGDTVVVQSTNVLAPVYVRYLFRKPVADPEVSLINVEGIPASSFITDNFLPPRVAFPPQEPLAISDHYSEDDPRAIVVPALGILENDSPGTNGTLSALLIGGVSHGFLEFNTDGSFIYAPTNGYIGNDAFSYVALNGAALSATTTVSLTIGESTGAITNFNDWATVHGVTADNEHVLDYAFNINPHLSSRYTLSVNSGNSGLPTWRLSESAGGGLILEFVRSTLPSDLTYQSQFGNNLMSNWVTSAATESISPVNGDWERVTIEDEVDIAIATNRFGRVIVIQD